MKLVPHTRGIATLIAIVLLTVSFAPPLSAAVPPNPPSPASPAVFSCDSVTEIPKSECEALVALYNSANGPGWKNNTGWLQTTTPCTWTGVSCSWGHVTELKLVDNSLSGTIPSQLGALTWLSQLYLYQNSLTGPIPTTFGSLSSLRNLHLWANQLSGPIPNELGNLSNLTYVYLQYNKLTGNIPPSLGNLTNLYHLYLSENELTGSVPSTLGNLKKVETLELSQNQLTGTIPLALANLVEVQGLYLSGNHLSGLIPPELGQLPKLYSLGLSDNALIGSIPPGLGNAITMRRLFLANNQLTGSVPEQLSMLTSLTTLTLRDNLLTGPLPIGLSGLSLSLLWYDETDLCEPREVSFQTWLASVDNLQRTNVLCGTQSVSGLVWNDLNWNGIQDASEPGVESAVVTLTQTKTAASVAAEGRRVFTDADGRYRFDYVAIGAHTIAVVKPGYLPSGSASIPMNVPEGGITVPPVGIVWAPTHIWLPLTRR